MSVKYVKENSKKNEAVSATAVLTAVNIILEIVRNIDKEDVAKVLDILEMTIEKLKKIVPHPRFPRKDDTDDLVTETDEIIDEE